MKKRLLSFILALTLLAASGCAKPEDVSSEPVSESGSSSETETESSEMKEQSVDRSGIRRLVSWNCEWKTECPVEADGISLTNGDLEVVGLTGDRFAKFKPVNKYFDIDVDLGAVVGGLADFELYYMAQLNVSSEPKNVEVFVSEDGNEYVSVGSADAAVQPDRNDAYLSKVTVEAEALSSARYVRFRVYRRKSGNMLIQQAAVYNYTQDYSATDDYKQAYTSAPESISVPYAAYSFVTLVPMMGATDAEWNEYFDNMQNAGIEGLVLLNAASFDGGLMSEKTWDKCLSMCQQRGMKVFTGLNMATHGDAYFTDKDLRDKLCANGIATANKLYSAYKTKYPDALYGWYLSIELNNGVYTKHPDECIELLNGYLDGLDKIDSTMPFMLSPFSAGFFGTAEALAPALTKVLTEAHFRSIDIYCPQDSVGAELIRLEDSEGYFKAAKEATDAAGIHLWANCENFVIKSSVPGHEDTVAAPVSRFVKQMQAVAKYAEKITTFTFEAYAPDKIGNYTIYTDTPYFYDRYLEYLNTGAVQTELLPGKLSVSSEDAGDGYAYITVSLDTPTYGFGALTVTRDGVTHTVYGMPSDTSSGKTYFIFRDYIGESNKAGYEFRVYDLASDESPLLRYGYNCDPIEVFGEDVDRTKQRTVISIGKTYTATAPNHSNGDSGTELTDGVYASGLSFGDPAWSGANSRREIVIDLGENVTDIADITLSCLIDGAASVHAPKTVEYFISEDGTDYISIGKTEGSVASASDLKTERQGIELEKCVSGRYVKLIIDVSGWLFMDEIEVACYR